MDRETIEQRFPVGSRWRTGGGSDIVIRAIDKFGVRWAYSDGDSGGAHIPWDTWASWSEEYERLDTPAPASNPEPVVRVGQVWRRNYPSSANGEPVDVTVTAATAVIRYALSPRSSNSRPRDEFLATFTLITDAPPQPVEQHCCNMSAGGHGCMCRHITPVEPPKPAVMCEYPDALGRRHELTTTGYDCCAVCGASASDRRAARRRTYDADVETHEHPWVDYRNGKLVEHVTRYVAALKSGGPASPVMPSAAMAIEALWQKLEAKRGARE